MYKTIDERLKEIDAKIKLYPIRQELYIKRDQLLGEKRKFAGIPAGKGGNHKRTHRHRQRQGQKAADYITAA